MSEQTHGVERLTCRLDLDAVVTQTLRIKLSGVERQKVIEDLVAVAAADLEIIDSEVALLQEAAMLLDVDPLFVDETIGRLLTSLD